MRMPSIVNQTLNRITRGDLEDGRFVASHLSPLRVPKFIDFSGQWLPFSDDVVDDKNTRYTAKQFNSISLREGERERNIQPGMQQMTCIYVEPFALVNLIETPFLTHTNTELTTYWCEFINLLCNLLSFNGSGNFLCYQVVASKLQMSIKLTITFGLCSQLSSVFLINLLTILDMKWVWLLPIVIWIRKIDRPQTLISY